MVKINIKKWLICSLFATLFVFILALGNFSSFTLGGIVDYLLMGTVFQAVLYSINYQRSKGKIETFFIAILGGLFSGIIIFWLQRAVPPISNVNLIIGVLAIICIIWFLFIFVLPKEK